MPRNREDKLDTLHRKVTEQYIARVNMGSQCSSADLKGAAEWLHKNNVTGIPVDGSPLKALQNSLTDSDQAFIERLTS